MIELAKFLQVWFWVATPLGFLVAKIVWESDFDVDHIGLKIGIGGFLVFAGMVHNSLDLAFFALIVTLAGLLAGGALRAISILLFVSVISPIWEVIDQWLMKTVIPRFRSDDYKSPRSSGVHCPSCGKISLVDASPRKTWGFAAIKCECCNWKQSFPRESILVVEYRIKNEDDDHCFNGELVSICVEGLALNSIDYKAMIQLKHPKHIVLHCAEVSSQK